MSCTRLAAGCRPLRRNHDVRTRVLTSRYRTATVGAGTARWASPAVGVAGWLLYPVVPAHSEEGSARRTLTADDRTGVATAVMNCCFERTPTPLGVKGPTHASTGENLFSRIAVAVPEQAPQTRPPLAAPGGEAQVAGATTGLTLRTCSCTEVSFSSPGPLSKTSRGRCSTHLDQPQCQDSSTRRGRTGSVLLVRCRRHGLPKRVAPASGATTGVIR